MAIIRNDRRARESAEQREEEPEEEVDYSWHPSDEEFPDPIPADRWLGMLDDPTVFDEDGLHAVECVDDYGGPVTFQQLSVKYRGTMGRYRRWLGGVAERAAQHEGREPLDLDGSGTPQWWPYLYRQRAVGKSGSNVYEMVLRPELTDALRRRSAASKARKREQERAQAEDAAKRRAEQRRARVEAAARAQAERDAAAAQAGAATQAKAGEAPKPAAEAAPSPTRPTGGTDAAPAAARKAARRTVLEPPSEGESPALAAFLRTMASIERGQRTVGGRQPGTPAEGEDSADVPARLDYAHRYGTRLREALGLVRAGLPGLTAAQVARELGDESVERLQSFLNGEAIPPFAYLSRIQDALFLDGHRLEAPEGLVDGLPVFCTFRERYGTKVGSLARERPREVVFVTDTSAQRRCGAIFRYSDLRCALVERLPVSADADRYHDPALSAYIRMVREADDAAKAGGPETRSVKVSADEWDALVAGRLWPGTVCA